MGWHVMIGAKTFGPLGAEQIGEMLRAGSLGIGAFVRDESAGDWLPVEKSPFHALIVKPRRKLIDIVLLAVAWIVGIYAAVWLLWLARNLR